MKQTLLRIREQIKIRIGYKYKKYTDEYIQYNKQAGNDYLRSRIIENRPLMVAKLGTTELSIISTYMRRDRGLSFVDWFHAILGDYYVDYDKAVRSLVKNSGFFPLDVNKGRKFVELMMEDLKEIDILGSYLVDEKIISPYIKNSTRIGLESYCAPFEWENPWTKELKGKKVLVVHPFTESIAAQYEKREQLFDNPDVLPEFSKITLIKAVQSIAGNGVSSEYSDWFEALNHMKRQMDKADYDVALIGCGAYGLPLAAHAKRNGKIAIHLAGWTQMLFGIYGERWVKDQPEYANFINESWVRPLTSEKPKGAETVENGCYW